MRVYPGNADSSIVNGHHDFESIWKTFMKNRLQYEHNEFLSCEVVVVQEHFVHRWLIDLLLALGDNAFFVFVVFL